MTKDRDIIWRARGMLANHAMEELYCATQEIIDKHGVDGAEIYLQAQLQFVRDVRDEKAGDEFGDDL